MQNYLFTSESVSEGHPDKMADQISDAVLDALLARTQKSRVACETMISTGFVTIAGEITTECYVDLPDIVRSTIKNIGYDSSDKGFDYQTCGVFTSIDRQSPDIAMGVDDDKHEQGAGDQGLMFGYAINETPEQMPLSISLSHKLVQELANLRKSGNVNFLRPDSKSQVTIEYENGKPKRIDAVVLSTQHSEDVTQKEIQDFVRSELIEKVVPKNLIDNNTKFHVNPTGRFVIGGPMGDCGLTGRKIIVDTYGGHGAHGGGAFSGKDPSKVDRSAAYAARHVAKNIVAAGLAEKCLVQVAYAIGVADPVSLMIEDYGTSKAGSDVLTKAVKEIWSLKPADIVKNLDLLKPRYKKTAAYGHFGREEAEFTWEATDKVAALKDVVKTLSK
ncbi:MAG: methionine adenosyltransferase [Bdellovibrionales bacterium]